MEELYREAQTSYREQNKGKVYAGTLVEPDPAGDTLRWRIKQNKTGGAGAPEEDDEGAAVAKEEEEDSEEDFGSFANL